MLPSFAKYSTLVATCVLGVFAGTSARATLLDTYTRSDLSAVPTASLGTTETGGYIYGERGDTPLTGTNALTGTAVVTGSKLQITGYAATPGTITSNPGNAYLTNFTSADASVSVDVSFQHNGTDPGSTSTSYMTTYAEIFFRTQVNANLGNSSSDLGLLDVSIGPNGDQQVREVQNISGAGTLTSLGSPASGYFANPFKATNSVTRTKVTDSASLARIANFNGHMIDANGNGFVDGDETFTFTASVEGNTVKTYIDGVQVGQWTTQNLTGLNGNLIALGKNRRAAADTFQSDVYFDNLDVTALPEPGSVAVMVVGMGLAAVRRGR